MNYCKAVSFLESFVNYEKASGIPPKRFLKLRRIKCFLKSIGNPQDSLKVIHIAGTKGKGSTAAFIAYILREAGFKTGLYTSPHLFDFRERIRILSPLSPQRKDSFEGMILRRELALLVEQFKPIAEKYRAGVKYGPLSFFELATALAFAYFKERKVDFVVLETGLGGKLDATNVVNALVSVITPISYEHTLVLGRTLRKIAREKSGIIKAQGSIVVSAPQEKEAREVIRQRCKKIGVKLCEAGQAAIKEYSDFRIGLKGKHQVVNAAVAGLAVKALSDYGVNVSFNSIKKGLGKAVWPIRCEVVSKKPAIVLDGAHNSASARALKKAISSEFRYKKLILILGILKDKDIFGICREVCPLADEIILTQADHPRAADIGELEKVISPLVKCRINKAKSVKGAVKLAMQSAGRRDLILACGSLFLAAEVRRHFT